MLPLRAARTIRDQLVDELWTRARPSLGAYMAALVASSFVIGAPLRASSVALAAYFVAFGVAFVRWALAFWIVPRLGALSFRVRYGVMLAGALVNGCALGVLTAIMYRTLEPVELGLWVAIVAGLSGGATISLGGRPEIFLAYATPSLVGGFVLAPMLWPRPGAGPLQACMFVYLLWGFGQVRQYRRARTEFLEQNEALLRSQAETVAKNEQLEAKNRELVAMTQRADRIFSALAEALPGRTIAGRYRLESRIGTGGFSVVFRGVHTELQRPVAVKIFRPQPGNDSAEALERFRFEGTATSRTRHPNLVEVFDAGVSEDGIPFIAMELLEGHALDVELRDGARIPVERLADVMAQACRGLAAAHAAGVIHRDVKPENIFLHRDKDRDVVKVLDFGIAKVMDPGPLGTPEMTGTGALLGTPHYMAPERFLGQASDESADAYSIGVILYRALAGRLPFEGTVAEIMVQVVTKTPPRLRTLAPGVAPELADVIMAALDGEPSARPSVSRIADVLSSSNATVVVSGPRAITAA